MRLESSENLRGAVFGRHFGKHRMGWGSNDR